MNAICLPLNPEQEMGFSVRSFQGKDAIAAGWGATVGGVYFFYLYYILCLFILYTTVLILYNHIIIFNMYFITTITFYLTFT